MAQAAAVPVPPDPLEHNRTQPPAGERVPAVNPILVPDDGHFPMYESVMDPVHLNGPNEQHEPAGRGPWRDRSAYLTEQHVELDDTCTICLSEAREGEMMCRLICRHIPHYR